MTLMGRVSLYNIGTSANCPAAQTNGIVPVLPPCVTDNVSRQHRSHTDTDMSHDECCGLRSTWSSRSAIKQEKSFF